MSGQREQGLPPEATAAEVFVPEPQFDQDAAAALALVTLLATAGPGAAELAGELVEDVLSRAGGERHLVSGLVSVCSGLLALLEFYGGLPPEDAARELGRLIAEASLPS